MNKANWRLRLWVLFLMITGPVSIPIAFLWYERKELCGVFTQVYRDGRAVVLRGEFR